MIVVDLGLSRGARGAGFVVGGVAHAGCGVFGEDHFPHRPRLGGEVRARRGHRVAALGGGGEVAFAGAFSIVGFGAVLIEQEQPQLGGVAQLFGPDPTATRTRSTSNCAAVTVSTQRRQPFDGVADDADVLTGDQTCRLGGGHGGQQRRQRLTNQAGAGGQVGGLVQPPRRLTRRQPPADPQHLVPRFGAHLPRGGFGLQPGQQPMGLGRHPAGQCFQVVDHRRAPRCGSTHRSHRRRRRRRRRTASPSPPAPQPPDMIRTYIRTPTNGRRCDA